MYGMYYVRYDIGKCIALFAPIVLAEGADSVRYVRYDIGKCIALFAPLVLAEGGGSVRYVRYDICKCIALFAPLVLAEGGDSVRYDIGKCTAFMDGKSMGSWEPGSQRSGMTRN